MKTLAIRARVAGVLAGLARPTARVRVTRAVPTPMSDGTILRADVWMPTPLDDAKPLILIRTPYERPPIDVVVYQLVSRGYPVVVQNCRGTLDSDGVFDPFRQESSDAADTIAWISDQPWGDRKISPFGVSYFGFTANTTFAVDPERIASIATGVTATDMRANILFPDGVLSSEAGLAWISGLTTQELTGSARQQKQRQLDEAMPAALAAPIEVADRALLGEEFPPYRDWVSHRDSDDPWWDPFRPTSIRSNYPPSVLIAGWYDPFVIGQLKDHEEIVAAGRDTRLVVGPWTHGSLSVASHLLNEGLALFDNRGVSTGASLYDIGARHWVDLPSWPPAARSRRLFLDGGARLRSTSSVDLDLSWTVGVGDTPPSAGGRGLNADFAGRRVQTAREQHAGVQVFSTGRIAAPVTIAGRVTVTLATDSAGDTRDWYLRLCDVDRFGVSRNVSDGFAQTRSSDGVVTVTLSPSGYTFRRGHRIRLQVCGTAQPFHSVPNGDPGRRIISNPQTASFVDLPVLEGGWPASK